MLDTINGEPLTDLERNVLLRSLLTFFAYVDEGVVTIAIDGEDLPRDDVEQAIRGICGKVFDLPPDEITIGIEDA